MEPNKKKTAEELFNHKLGEEMQKALKKELPFCDRAAKDDFYGHYREQAQKSLRANGYVKAEDIKPIEMDWSKYSDINNFEFLEEGEVPDEYLTKKHPGLDIQVAKKVYRFKGYSNKYTLMESATSAILRARKKLKELEGAK